MSNIYINLREVKNANYNLPLIEMQTNYIKRKTQNIKREIPNCISEKYRIGQRLDAVIKEMDILEAWVNRMYRITNACMEQYADTERKNNGNAQAFYDI